MDLLGDIKGKENIISQPEEGVLGSETNCHMYSVRRFFPEFDLPKQYNFPDIISLLQTPLVKIESTKNAKYLLDNKKVLNELLRNNIGNLVAFTADGSIFHTAIIAPSPKNFEEYGFTQDYGEITSFWAPFEETISVINKLNGGTPQDFVVVLFSRTTKTPSPTSETR